MYGILTGDAEAARAGVGDAAYYFAEQVSGERRDPLPGATNAVACWGDTATVREEPSRAAVDGSGARAHPDEAGHHWGTVCPTDPDYRAALLDRIESIGGDVWLTTPGFPGEGFCRCDRCDRLFAGSDRTDRDAWRTDVVTAFVADAAARVEGDLAVALYPDPYPGNLRERAGLDPRALAAHVDEFVVPLCDTGYETSYWVESLARGFAEGLADLDADLVVQLSTDGVEADRLVGVVRRIDDHVDGVLFGTRRGDAETVRDVIGRLRDADEAVATA